MAKFIRVTEIETNTTLYIPLKTIQEISVVSDEIIIYYSDDCSVIIKETEDEISRQINS